MEKRLYKSSQNKVIAGVCGGIGEYFGIDPVIVRLIAVVFTLMGGSGIIAYIIAAIIVPGKIAAGGNTSAGASAYGDNYPEAPRRDGQRFIIILLIAVLVIIAIGGLFFFRHFIYWMGPMHF